LYQGFNKKMSSQIVKRYAAAYFKVAEEEKAFPYICSDLKVLETIELKFKKVFLNENRSVSTKSERFLFVRKLFSEYKFHEITKNLLYILAEHRSFDLLEGVIKHWNKLFGDYKNRLEFEVVSVKSVKPADLEYIEKFFEKKFAKEVLLKNTLDSSILGGMIIRFRSFVLDGSIANKIKNVGFTLTGNVQ